jgi:hypothetical protein
MSWLWVGLIIWAAIVVGTVTLCAATAVQERRERMRRARRGGYIR